MDNTNSTNTAVNKMSDAKPLKLFEPEPRPERTRYPGHYSGANTLSMGAAIAVTLAATTYLVWAMFKTISWKTL